jgi:hypothetical protein
MLLHDVMVDGPEDHLLLVPKSPKALRFRGDCEGDGDDGDDELELENGRAKFIASAELGMLATTPRAHDNIFQHVQHNSHFGKERNDAELARN